MIPFQPFQNINSDSPRGCRCPTDPQRIIPTVTLQNLHMRDGNDEPSTPLPNISHLLDNFLFDIPGKDQNIIGFVFPDLIRVFYRNMASRQIAVLLMGTPVHGIIQKVRPDPAIIQERVPLGRRAVSDNLFPLFFQGNQALKKISLDGLDFPVERKILSGVSDIPFPSLWF